MRVAILLAAGRSRRFAGGNKLLARHGGSSLVRHALRSALDAPVGRVIVVLGHDAERVSREMHGGRVRRVLARRHREGVGASLRSGLAALWPIEREIFVFLGDMPGIPAGLPRRLARALRPGIAAVRPRGRREPGHPVLLRRPDRTMISRLCGDRGLAALMTGPTRWIDVIERRPADIDTRRDLARWR